jgi:hypothetical protein
MTTGPSSGDLRSLRVAPFTVRPKHDILKGSMIVAGAEGLPTHANNGGELPPQNLFALEKLVAHSTQ